MMTRISIAAILLVLIGGGYFVWSSRASYQDAQMIRHFTENEPQFKELVGMAMQDPKMDRIAPTFTRTANNYQWPRPEQEWGITAERWNAYKIRFESLQIKSGLERHNVAEGEDAALFFIVRTCGYFSDCDDPAKGYAYSVAELSPQVDSLDKVETKTIESGVVYRKIKENWYLYVDFR